MSHLRDKYAIVGTGRGGLGHLSGVSSLGLLQEAINNALDEAGLIIRDVDGLVCRGADDIYAHHQMMGARLGINAAFSTSLDNGGASQILAVILAVMAIDAGLATTVVCGFGRDSWSRTRVSFRLTCKTRSCPVASVRASTARNSGIWAPSPRMVLGARRHMFEYGTTREDFAAVAIDFREHALRNPDAMMKKPLTFHDYMAARMIVDPFGLYDCSLMSDGAGAVIVTSAERARSLKARPVLIKGFATFNNTKGWHVDDHMVTTSGEESGERAYRMAGLGPKDVDVVQLYDCFTYMVLAQLEDYGFCKKGESGAFARSGALRIDGALPANTSGGQLSEAHVEGMLQIVEGVRQLQGVYGPDRQVRDAEISLVSGHGGNYVCHSTLILGKA